MSGTPSGMTDAPTSCGCEEQRGLSRRGFLRSSMAAIGAGMVGSTLQLGSASVALADGPWTGDVIVVLSLRGGFDGLSAIVPAADPAYAAARPTIGVPTGQLLQLDAMFGLHPAMAPLLPLFQSGGFAAVHAVGQADPTRSHFDAMEEMERAAPGSGLRTGWIDRMVGVTGSATPFTACHVGDGSPSTSFNGPHPELSVGDAESFGIAGAGNAKERARMRAVLGALHSTGPAAVLKPARTTLGVIGTLAGLGKATPLPAGGPQYPANSGLGRALRDVAHLIKAGVGVRVAAVDFGGWDMHENLGGVDGGWMHNQLTELASALAAFAADLGDAFGRTTLVTLSEFGRRVSQNGSGGLDHGHGNAVLLLGGGVNGGRVYGRWPGLGAGALVEGDLAGTTDYRSILAEVLETRCGVAVGSVFPGVPSARLGLARAK